MSRVTYSLVVALTASILVVIVLLAARYTFREATSYQIVGYLILTASAALMIGGALRSRSVTDEALNKRAYRSIARGFFGAVIGFLFVFFSDALP